MGLIGRILGIGVAAREVGAAVGGVAEVFVGNRAEREAAAAKRSTRRSAVRRPSSPLGGGPFDRFVDALEPAAAAAPGARHPRALRLRHGRADRLLHAHAGSSLVPSRSGGCSAPSSRSTSGARELHHQRTAHGAAVPAPRPPPPRRRRSSRTPPARRRSRWPPSADRRRAQRRRSRSGAAARLIESAGPRAGPARRFSPSGAFRPPSPACPPLGRSRPPFRPRRCRTHCRFHASAVRRLPSG